MGIANNLLSRGESCVVVTRDIAKEDKFRLDLQEIHTPHLEKLFVVEGNFLSDGAAQQVFHAVAKHRPKHVICILGSVDLVEEPPSEATPDKLHSMVDIFTCAVRSINAFTATMKYERGTSFTMHMGGYGHGATDMRLWSATLKNGLLHHVRISRDVRCCFDQSLLQYHKVLAAELQDAPMRFNTACLHYTVSLPNVQHKKSATTSSSALDYGAAITALLADNSLRSQLICFTDPDATKTWVSQRKRVEQ